MKHLCEICGKPGSYPNFVIVKGKHLHVQCMAGAFDALLKLAKGARSGSTEAMDKLGAFLDAIETLKPT